MSTALLVLAFTFLPPPAPPVAPPAIAPEVSAVQAEYGIKPLPVPERGIDPVAAGLIPADIDAEAARVRAEMDAGNRAIVEHVGGQTVEPVKLWKGAAAEVPDLTQVKPPERCTAALEGWRYVDQAVAAVCVCTKARWCPEGKMPKKPCAGDAATCR